MTFTLYGVEYPFKFSLGAFDTYEKLTGGKSCLWKTNISMLAKMEETKGSHPLEVIRALCEVVTFKEGAYYLYSIAKQENSKVTIQEIQDGMIHCGVLESEDDKKHPWQLIILECAYKFFNHQAEVNSEKK